MSGMLIGFDKVIYGTEAAADIKLSRTCFVNTMVSKTGLNHRPHLDG